MSRRPVFVVHGISNRSPSVLEERVAALSEAAFGRWAMYPTYWGDLGATHLGVDLVMPESLARRSVRSDSLPKWGVRGAAPSGSASTFSELRPWLDAGLMSTGERDPGNLGFVVDAVRSALAGQSRHDVRGDVPQQLADEAEAAIVEAWPDTRWLSHTDDLVLLTEVAAVLATAVAEHFDDDQHAVREPGRIRRLVGRRLPELDRLAGAAVASAGERFYTWFRIKHAEYVAKTLGDILVYQRHGEEIRERVRSQIAAAVPGAGERPDAAVHLVGHSLGAVIALDLATDVKRPVHTAGLVTFGCQWPLFHIVDPRSGVEPYRGEPVALPATIGRWTNLWHPLDPLGFVVGRIVRGVEDVRVDHLVSEEFYAHSTYWIRPELVAALVRTFT